LDNQGFRVHAVCRNFSAQEALHHWRNNPECLALAKAAIDKADDLFTMSDKYDGIAF
jgi:hypothetical protein